MQTVVTRENWTALVAQAGLRLEEVALRTGRSFSAVYRYSRWPEPKTGRKPPDEWLAKVQELLGHD